MDEGVPAAATILHLLNEGETRNFHVGELALLQEEVCPHHMWKRGLTEELQPRRDARIRTVILRTQGDTKQRELLKCVVAVKQCIRGGGRHLQDVIFKH